MKKTISNVMRPLTQIVKILAVLLVIFFGVLYLLAQPTSQNTEVQEVKLEMSKEEFLEQLAPYAQEVSVTHGVRPSLLVAQAALESNWGKSQLAQDSNNYFGVKNPIGREYSTKEFTQNEWTEINASFREYDSVYDSVLDYANLLKNGTSWDENLYQEVIEASTYKEAAYALTKAGYATDPNYAEKIIQIIDSHHLDRFDNF